MSSERALCTRVPDHRRGPPLRKQTVTAITIDAGPERGVAMEGATTVGNGLYLQGQIVGSTVNFLVDTGFVVAIVAARVWRQWGRPGDELRKHWGGLCSVEGRALECMGRTRLAVTLGTHVITWDFILVEIGKDEGMLGNEFAMALQLTVQPHEGAVHLPTASGGGKVILHQHWSGWCGCLTVGT